MRSIARMEEIGTPAALDRLIEYRQSAHLDGAYAETVDEVIEHLKIKLRPAL